MDEFNEIANEIYQDGFDYGVDFVHGFDSPGMNEDGDY
jgi:hypothetical protein